MRNTEGESKRGFASLTIKFPLPLIREGGVSKTPNSKHETLNKFKALITKHKTKSSCFEFMV